MAKEIYGKSKTLKRPVYSKFLKLILAAILMSFALNYFIIPLGILSAGLGGFVQGLSYTISSSIGRGDDNQFILTLYWSIIFGLNIPIAIFTYFYYGKKLFYYSIFTFMITLLASFFFTFVPGFNNASYIGDNPTVSETLVMSIVGGALYGIATGLVFSQGSTSLGIDPVTRYFGREKGYNLSKVTFTISIISSFFWIFIIKIIDSNEIGGINSFSDFITKVIFAPEILGSLTFIIVYALIVGYVYPTSRKYLVEINSKKVIEISDKLIEMNYHRGHSIEEILGGYTKEKRLIIKILINSEEFDDIVKIVRTIDEEAFMYATQAKQAYSKNHEWNPETLEDKDIKVLREKYFHAKNSPKSEKTKGESYKNKDPFETAYSKKSSQNLLLPEDKNSPKSGKPKKGDDQNKDPLKDENKKE